MEKYLLGIDVGTTGTKTILFSAARGMIAADYQAYELQTPAVGYSEQEAEDWWRAVVKTVRTVCKGLENPGQVEAISLSLQGGTMVPVDERLCPLHPAIVWNDSRCGEEAQDFQERFGFRYLYEKSGWNLGHGLNAMEILWLRRHRPEVFSRAAYFLSVPDYIAARMTGVPALDLSNAGINQLADIAKGSYDPAILDFVGIGPEKLGRIVRSGEVIGPLTEEAAEELGLTTHTVLVAGAHDQYAVAAGAGCSQAGDILIGTGTAWVVTALSREPDFTSGFSQSAAAVKGLWGSLISMTTGGVCLEWFRKNLAQGEGEEPLSYERINEMAEKSGIGAGGLLFYPYFSGGSYPLSDQVSKASLIGLDLSHNQSDIARAILEGVAYQIVWILEKFLEKFPTSSLKLSGGATKSALWCQIIADVSGLPVRVPAVADLACVGAAVLAGIGSGVFADPEEGYRCLAVEEREILPNPEHVRTYTKLFANYKKGAEQLGMLYKSFQQ